MPIYEYACNACNSRLSVFVRSIGGEANPVCKRCGGTDVRRLMSSFRVLRPAFNPESFNKQELLDGVDYSDPASMANMFRRMNDTFQDEPNEHMDEIVGRLERGEAVDQALDMHSGHEHESPGGDE